MIQTAAVIQLAPELLIGILFLLEVITGIVLEKKRRRINGSAAVVYSPVCADHADLMNRLTRIERKLDQADVLDRLDNINDLLTDLKGLKT